MPVENSLASLWSLLLSTSNDIFYLHLLLIVVLFALILMTVNIFNFFIEDIVFYIIFSFAILILFHLSSCWL